MNHINSRFLNNKLIVFLFLFINALVLTVNANTKAITTPNNDTQAITSHYIEVNNIKLHYVSAGQGRPVLLIPGWFQTWYSWRFIIPELVDQGFQVIAVDPRGMGYSDKPLTGYDTGQVADDLNKLMLGLGHNNYAVVGHDIGMWVGYAMGSDYPKNVSKLAIVEAIIPGLLKNPPEVFMEQSQSAFFWQFMFNQQPDLPELLIQDKEDQFLSYLFSNWAYHPEKIALDEYVKAYKVPSSIRAQMAYYRAFPQTIAQNQERAKQRLPMPVLTLGGDHGVADFPREMMEPVTTQLASGVLKNCGHFATEECPDAILEQLIPFLKAN